MVTFFIIFIFSLSIILLLSKCFKSGLSLLIIALILAMMNGFGVISAILLQNLETYPFLIIPNWEKNNAIIILGAGAVDIPHSNNVKPTIMAYSRIFEAARLYNSCKKNSNACTIIISGGDALSKGKSEAEVYQNELNNIGINNSDIILEPRSINTYQNAEFTSTIINSKHFDNIILDTSGIHMKRSLLYFSHFGISATPAIADYIEPKMFTDTLGFNFAISDFAAHEYAGIMRYYIYNSLGLNNQQTKQGSP